MTFNSPPQKDGWGDDVKKEPQKSWAMWFQNVWFWIQNPTAPTQAPGDNTTAVATDAFVQAAITAAITPISGTKVPYTPTVTTTVGAITSYASTGYYIEYPGYIIVHVFVNIINNGTGAGVLQFSLPKPSNANFAYTSGTAFDASSALQKQAFNAAATSILSVLTPAGAYPATTGSLISADMVYPKQ